MIAQGTVNLTRGEKILLALYDLSGNSRKSIRYEDIVVAVFKRYPSNFGLKGYPEYPDSGDLVHKPLYEFKKKGLVEAGNKMFALTERGVVAAERLRDALGDTKVATGNRMGRDIEKEITRISKTPGFQLFTKGDFDKLVDTDVFDLIAATVRTPRNQFIGRIRTIKEVVKATKVSTLPLHQAVAKYCEYMVKQFEGVIKYKSEH